MCYLGGVGEGSGVPHLQGNSGLVLCKGTQYLRAVQLRAELWKDARGSSAWTLLAGLAPGCFMLSTLGQYIVWVTSTSA
jgi:hypothetical protein